jgi:hypothetical protein
MIGLKVSINGGEPIVCAAEDLAVLVASVELYGPLGKLTREVRPGVEPKCRANAGGLTRRAVGQQDEHVDWIDQRVLSVGDTVTIEVIATDSPSSPVRHEPADGRA